MVVRNISFPSNSCALSHITIFILHSGDINTFILWNTLTSNLKHLLLIKPWEKYLTSVMSLRRAGCRRPFSPELSLQYRRNRDQGWHTACLAKWNMRQTKKGEKWKFTKPNRKSLKSCKTSRFTEWPWNIVDAAVCHSETRKFFDLNKRTCF